MSQPGFVVVKEEVHELDAEVVAAFLRSEGIEAQINVDDAGRMLPSLDESRFSQVLVPEADAERARKLIAEHATSRGAKAGDEEE